MDFAVAADHRLKRKENKKIHKYLNLARGRKQDTVKHEGDDDTSCGLYAGNGLQRFEKMP